MCRKSVKVPFLDLLAANQTISDELGNAVARVVASGCYISGNEVEIFEQNFARYVQTDHCVGVGNGFDALLLSLMALGIGPGDEVIVPSHTFVATWLAVSHCGANLIPAEVNPATYNIDFDSVEARISAKTKAIIVVHLYGQPADLDAAITIREKYGVAIIEDAAQAHGARYKKKKIGGHGDLVAWSFYPGKNLGAMGDGGAVTTNDSELAGNVRRLANYGSRKKYIHDIQGVNSRLDPIQAAILDVKLRYIDEWNERRRHVAEIYLKRIKSPGIRLPVIPDWAEPVWHLFVVACDERSVLQRALSREGVETLIHYPVPPARQQAYKGMWDTASRSVLQISDQVLSLPIGPHLSCEDAVYVADVVAKVAQRR